MTVCPIAIVAGCKKCPVFAICPATTVLGDQTKDSPADTAKPAAKPAAKPGKKWAQTTVMAIRRLVRLACVFFACCAVGGVMAAEPLTLCVEDAPQRPWTLPTVAGLSIDLLREVAKRRHEQFQFVVRPWRRCLEDLRVGEIDAVVGGAATAERSAYARYPMGDDGQPDPQRALYADRYDVYKRRDSTGHWDGKVLTLPARPTILVQRGYVVADLLRSRGFAIDERASSAQDALRHLTDNYFDIAIIQASEANMEFRGNAAFHDQLVREATPYFEAPMYLMVSHPSYGRNPKRIEQIWHAIGAVRHSADYQRREKAALNAP